MLSRSEKFSVLVGIMKDLSFAEEITIETVIPVGMIEELTDEYVLQTGEYLTYGGPVHSGSIAVHGVTVAGLLN